MFRRGGWAFRLSPPCPPPRYHLSKTSMSLTPTPAPLENLGPRPFSFFPPILHIEHNEFLYRRSTWSEVLVVNCKSGEEIWIPRRFLGERLIPLPLLHK